MDFISKFNFWKNSLLDLGKRNKLINFKETKRSTVTIISPDIHTLWNKIVDKEEKIEFPNVLEDFDSDEENDEEYLWENDDEDYGGEVKTSLSVKELQKTLRNIKSRAKTSKEELGINSLYIGFGFLRWKEREDSDYEFKSPLILVPIEIGLEDLQSPFTFSILQGDDIIINPALAYKLISDFGIDLNCDISELDVKGYIEFVKNKIKNTNWTIEEKASIALLSFYKISMYNDLLTNKDKIEQSPIMQLIMGNTDYVQEIPDSLNDIDFDKDIKVKESFQVVDADSSQLEAIEYAKNGVSFVLQGPPGTGKSQTITNMIAELMAQGKKVLFVSSKMAALEVVYKRMIKANLGHFCMSLHDPKTNKKEILKELDEVLRLTNSKYELNEQADYDLEKLQLIKDKINNYYHELHKIRKPLNRTVYQINGEIAKLYSTQNIIFDFNNISQINQEHFNSIIYVLEEYVRTIGENTHFWKTNCWYGVKRIELSNEMRHDIGYHLDNLYNKLYEFNNTSRVLQDLLNIKIDITRDNNKQILDLLKDMRKIINFQSNWFFNENIEEVLAKVNYQVDIEKQIETCKNDILTYNDNYKIIDMSDNYSYNLENIRNIIKSEYLYEKLNEYPKEEQEKVFNALKKYLDSYNKIVEPILQEYDRDILDINYKDILRRYKSEYTSPLKIFNKNYKSDKKLFVELKKEISKNITDEEILNVLNSLNEIENIKYNNIRNFETWKSFYGEYFQEFETDEEMLTNKINNYYTIKELENKLINIIDITNKSLNDSEIKDIFDENYDTSKINWNKTADELKDYIKIVNLCKKLNIKSSIPLSIKNSENSNDYLEKQISLLEINYSKIIEEIDWFTDLFQDTTIITNLSNDELLVKVNNCRKSYDILEKYLDYKKAKDNCIDFGLKDFIDKIEDENINVNNTEIIDVFRKRFYSLWLDYIEHDSEELLNFRRENFEMIIREFKNLDVGQYKINQLRIFRKIISSFPNFDRFSNGNDEISILKRELNKNKKTMSLRRLFNSIPTLIMTLKPCLMMSPLSVSIFLDSKNYSFDTVIFDEASQIKTEDAIGAIIRGKQLIIVGDNKQLPPTNFFTSSISETEELEEFDDIGAYESILDEASLLPEKTLLWHYRSKYESLIAFSNAKFYSNRLITFPSNSESVQNNGVEFFYVENGRYDKGGRKGNTVEAQKVADLVFEHFRNNPERSLGVIAFGEVQQYAIENEINKKRIEDPSLEEFFLEDNEEAFFVKNLENVQGDERDTIIFSIGYAKDNQGKLNMNFGPLSRIGGERRLNVAVSRAKYNIKLVSSILSNEIDTERINTEGPKLLKKYIQFAKDGISVLQNEIEINDINYFDSPFEEDVYNVLVQSGYDVSTQIGCSGYRIDMAVRNPKNKDIFSIGIECDGATYHSSRIARERDRLRQAVLEDMGWKIYRIWSTDWIKNKEKETQKLLNIVEKSNENLEYTKDNQDKNEDNVSKYISITNKDELDNMNPYDLDIYYKYSYDYSKLKNIPIEQILKEVIDIEYPIHFDEICRRVSMHYLSMSATKKVKDNVRYALYKLANDYICDDNFYMPKNAKNKARSNIQYNNSYLQEYFEINGIKYANLTKDTEYLIEKRQIKYIYKKELANIMKKIREKSINIDKYSLFEETAKVLNLRFSSNILYFEVAYEFIDKI